MAVLKCKMCGGDIQAKDGAAYGTCTSCGTTSTLPKASDERKANLFNRANHFRRQNDFDKAMQAYESILNDDNEDAEAHWNVVLSRYGIEYVKDPATGQRVPVCRRVQSEPILKDADYLEALKYAPDPYAKSLYEEEAKKISEIQKRILAISSKEQPYDVFICYKEKTDGGSRTKDSAIAQDIYYELTKDGYKVFFARITLEDKLGKQYEPYIFSALNSAKVMLVIGTKKEHFEAVWVKNEWSRFLAIMKKDPSRLLIPCYSGMDAYDIPDELSALQSQDMSKIGFIQDILRGVKKILDASKSKSAEKAPSATSAGAAPGVESLMKRGKLFLEDSDWKQANEYFDRVLDIDPEYAPAYVGKLCAELNVQQEELLGNYKEPILERNNFKKAVRFADANYRAKLEGYNKSIQERLAEERRREQERIAKEKRLDQEHLAKARQVLPKYRERIAKFQKCISSGWGHTVGLKTDGTVVAVGYNKEGQCNTGSWRDIVAIAAGGNYIVGLKADGTVVAVGYNKEGQCNTWSWRDIVAIATGSHTVGLKADGTVVAVGNNEHGQCNTESWKNIVAITTDHLHTVGLKANGTVVAVGYNKNGQCNTESWQDIVAIAAGGNHTVGLKADGRVIAVGDNAYDAYDTDSWRDIVAVAAGSHTVGLKADGTVVAAGYNKDGQYDTGSWRDIVAIAAGSHHIVGLKANGTVVSVGDIRYGQCNTENWQGIVAIATSGGHAVGLKADGTVVAVGSNAYGQCNTENWRGIGNIQEEKRIEWKRRAEQERMEQERLEQQRLAQQRQAEKEAREAAEKLAEEKATKRETEIFLRLCLCAVYLFILWGTGIIRTLWLADEFTFVRCLPFIIFSLAIGMMSLILFKELDVIYDIFILIVMILVQSITICVWRRDVGILLIYLIIRIVINTLCAIPGIIFLLRKIVLTYSD